jgi:hypothetical protein
MISTRFLDETLWAILSRVSFDYLSDSPFGCHILGGVGVLMHQQQLNILGVADEEGLGQLASDRKNLGIGNPYLQAVRGHVAGLAVAAVANLQIY